MTRANQDKPTRRTVAYGRKNLVVEIGEFDITMRPSGTRKGGPAEVTIPWAAAYERALMLRVATHEPRHTKRRVTRGTRLA